MTRSKGAPAARRSAQRATPQAVRPLYRCVDHGSAVILRQTDFGPQSRGGGWGTFAESFLRFNERTLAALDVSASIVASSPEPTIRLQPGGRAGAVPLRSAQTAGVVAGLVVRPRFGWAGVGQVMSDTGWSAVPEFLDAPLVPGSAREVPPWVLAGPVLARLGELLRHLIRGYVETEAVTERPRGRILWSRYVGESLSRGAWHHLPCRFPELSLDPWLRGAIRWALERIRGDLIAIGRDDPIATRLSHTALLLIEGLKDVRAARPRAGDLQRLLRNGRATGSLVGAGIEALAWVVDERGLGGGRELDGLAWQLPLEVLWERFVESVVRAETTESGGEVRVGRLRETIFPIHWMGSTSRSMNHLTPDIVVRRGRSIRIVDAKYKAHFSDLDETGWWAATNELRQAHRADLHQILAYASLYDAEDLTATLVYPLRWSTWSALRDRGRDRSKAELLHGGRRIVLELRGMPFGGYRGEV